MNIIDGSTLSCYKTTSIQLGMSKKAGINGKQSKYIVFFVKNRKARATKPRHLVIFDEDEPGLFDTFKKYTTANTPDANGRYTVDIQAMSKSDDAETLEDFMEFPGMQTAQYKLRKGLCYMNNVNGERVLDKDKQPVITDTITVLVWVNYIMDTGKGLEPKYFDGYELEKQGERMERNFYKEAVNKTTTVEPEPAAETEAEAGSEEPTPF